jgi:hypothetical protein
MPFYIPLLVVFFIGAGAVVCQAFGETPKEEQKPATTKENN